MDKNRNFDDKCVCKQMYKCAYTIHICVYSNIIQYICVYYNITQYVYIYADHVREDGERPPEEVEEEEGGETVGH